MVNPQGQIGLELVWPYSINTTDLRQGFIAVLLYFATVSYI